LAICLDVAVLILSKYLNFITSQVANPLGSLMNLKIEAPNLPLLLGISFITFHRISFLVDSYKGRAIPPRNFIDCALYIFLFPQLIAGPIIRYHDIGNQIHDRKHTAEDFLTGFFRFSIGLTKKTILADPLGLVADKIFGLQTKELSFIFAWGGIISYSLQIYFDFSAYSDMAIGLGRMMGFRFPENFNRPYVSRSVTEFWRRWHISLSNWMRLYLYIPLGGNRVSALRNYINLWIVFLISGIWHGASWNFVVWGAYYGFFLTFERAFSSKDIFRIPLPDMFRHSFTMLVVMVGWVFFRSTTMDHAVKYIEVMFAFEGQFLGMVPPWGLLFGNRDLATIAAASLLAFVKPPAKWILATKSLQAAWSETITVQGAQVIFLPFFATLLLLFISVSAIVSSDYSPFLYFRF
jgi:alginate O-acetyltransferase complex protein AlgI